MIVHPYKQRNYCTIPWSFDQYKIPLIEKEGPCCWAKDLNDRRSQEMDLQPIQPTTKINTNTIKIGTSATRPYMKIGHTRPIAIHWEEMPKDRITRLI